MIYFRSPPSLRVTHKTRGVSHQPDREGLAHQSADETDQADGDVSSGCVAGGR